MKEWWYLLAIYHLEAKVISRGSGRSVVAAAAYISCSKITNEYDGVQHDYTRKRGLVWQHIFLPQHAPEQWKERNLLWNAVEEAEKAKDSRLAREVVVALPVELDQAAWSKLLTEFVTECLVEEGMCADVCIHDTDGHNPHAHIIATVRPLEPNGRWQYKTEKEYICVLGDKEKCFTAKEFQQAKQEGWEKQYQYLIDGKKLYMTPAAAALIGGMRFSKTPKSTRFGRQNPIAARWSSEEQLLQWRAAWAQMTNRYLERHGMDCRVDHRSNADRGISEQATVHEGVVARAMEQQGLVADRCELNRRIKADNKLLRELRAAYDKLSQAVCNTVPMVAQALETLRSNMIVFRYQMRMARENRMVLSQKLEQVEPRLARFDELTETIKRLTAERKQLLAEKQSLAVLHFLKHRDLATNIARLTEEKEELQNEKALLLRYFEKIADGGLKGVFRWRSSAKASVKMLEKVETENYQQINAALMEFQIVKDQASELDEVALCYERTTQREVLMQQMYDKLEKIHGEKYDRFTALGSEQDVEKLLHEDEKQMRRLLNQVQNNKGQNPGRMHSDCNPVR